MNGTMKPVAPRRTAANPVFQRLDLEIPAAGSASAQPFQHIVDRGARTGPDAVGDGGDVFGGVVGVSEVLEVRDRRGRGLSGAGGVEIADGGLELVAARWRRVRVEE
jgi:hypothetical protein